MFVQLVIVVGAHIAARKEFFQMTEKISVHGHYVFKMAVLGAIFDHQDLAIALDDLCLDLAHFFVEQDLMRQLAIHDLLANLRHAARAERIGAARPAQRRLALLPGLEQRLVGPFWGERRIGVNAVQLVKNLPGGACGHRNRLLNVFHWFMHLALFSLSKIRPELSEFKHLIPLPLSSKAGTARLKLRIHMGNVTG